MIRWLGMDGPEVTRTREADSNGEARGLLPNRVVEDHGSRL